MKLTKSIIATALIAGSLVAGSASAMTPVNIDGLSSSTNVNVSVKDGVATLFGSVDSQFERIQVANAAKKLEGVNQVRNLLTFSQ